MANRWLADLIGTFKTTFRIGPKTTPAILSASSLTAARTFTLPDATGTVALLSNITGTNSGVNTGDQTITLTGAVTGSGTGSFTTTFGSITGPSVLGHGGSGSAAPSAISSGGGDLVLRANGANTSIAFGTVATGGIADDAVTNAKLRESAGFSVIGRSLSSTGNPADIVATAQTVLLCGSSALGFTGAASDGQVLRRSSGTLGFGAVDLASANAVTGLLPAANLTAGSDTAAGAVEIATAAEIETGTDTVRAVTPGRLGSHRAAAKAWVIFTVSGTTVTVRDSYNVSSVTRNGTGDYSINFTTAFSSAWYCMACGATVNTAGTVVLFGFPNNLSAPTASVGRAIYVNSSGVAADPARVDISFFGDQ